MEFPPKKPVLRVSSRLGYPGGERHAEVGSMDSMPNTAAAEHLRGRILHTLLIQDNDIAAIEIDGVRSTQAGHWRGG